MKVHKAPWECVYAKEEKTHFGEFQALLLKLDKEQVEELEKGKEEIEELTG